MGGRREHQDWHSVPMALIIPESTCAPLIAGDLSQIAAAIGFVAEMPSLRMTSEDGDRESHALRFKSALLQVRCSFRPP